MFRVDDKCIKCGLCSSLCPPRILKTGEGGVPFVSKEAEADCIKCGQCVVFCPKGACYLNFQPASDRAAVNTPLLPSTESAETFLRSRRSVRRFKEEGLPRELICRLLETARYAPTGSNKQEVRWLISETRGKTMEIAEHVIDFFRSKAGSGDPNARFYADVTAGWDSGHDVIMRGAPNIALAVIPASNAIQADGAIALTYLELAAYANGVGCCWSGFVTVAARNSREFRRFLGVRDDEVIAGGQMMGFPEPSVATGRLLPPRKKADVSWI